MFFVRKRGPIFFGLLAIGYIVFICSHARNDLMFEILLCIGFLICGTYYKIEKSFLHKYILGIRVRTITISNIDLIEVVTVSQVARVAVRIGKRSKYDGFYLHIKDGTKYKLYQDFTNKDDIELGTYLISKMHIRSQNIKKKRFFSDRL